MQRNAMQWHAFRIYTFIRSLTAWRISANLNMYRYPFQWIYTIYIQAHIIRLTPLFHGFKNATAAATFFRAVSFFFFHFLHSIVLLCEDGHSYARPQLFHFKFKKIVIRSFCLSISFFYSHSFEKLPSLESLQCNKCQQQFVNWQRRRDTVFKKAKNQKNRVTKTTCFFSSSVKPTFCFTIRKFPAHLSNYTFSFRYWCLSNEIHARV